MLATVRRTVATGLERAARAVMPMQVRNSTLFDAGANTRRTIGWRAPTSSANQAILANLTTIRDRSRAATRNHGYANSVITSLVSEIVGTGIKPMCLADDVAFRKQLQALWLRWTDQSDADGQSDFYGQQTQAVRTWLEGGEAFARVRMRDFGDGLAVPLQVQVLEPELCPHSYTILQPRIRAGIEFSPIGKRVAYYFHPSRPELDDFDASQLRRVPADSVSHLFLPLRPGQLRGLPHLTQALITLNELDKCDDAIVLRQQLANMFVGFITRPQPALGDAEETNPLTGAEQTLDADSKQYLAFEPGTLQELEEGEAMQFSTPPEANGYADFMKQALRGVAAATGVPYEVITTDMSGINDRLVRVIFTLFRRRVQALQHQVVVYQFCRPIWKAFMDRVFLSGALPIPLEYLQNPEPWARVKWMPQAWPYLHPVQDVEAEQKAVRNGFKSRAAVVSERGEDVETIDAEQAADNARADALGLKFDSDGRTKAAPSAAPSATADDPPEPVKEPEEVAA
jgi:lambda family phage portal protein